MKGRGGKGEHKEVGHKDVGERKIEGTEGKRARETGRGKGME